MQALLNKVAIVAGASSGIGYATARLFAREGAKLIVAARRKTELDALVKEITEDGGCATAVAGDVREESYARALVDAATAQYGGLDIAFNNVGTLGPMAPTPEIALSDWTKTLETNLTSAFLAAKYQAPAMVARGGGSLIFTSTFVGHTIAFPGMAAYAASKSGLIGLVQALAVEFAMQGIRANAILPGGTDTAMYREMNNTKQAQDFVVSLYPARRLAEPEEIAKSVLYLASDASSFTTGTAMLVDGGVSINRT
jgi:NAD(P)-dependent dehydrogenase (short-subunit alcohol dehydrogenase family)